jgi:hypothetical protein
MPTVKQAPKKSKQKNAIMPIIGLTLAILLAVIAYVAAPALINFGEKNDKVGPQLYEFQATQKNGELLLHVITSGILWLTMLALCMFIVSAAVAGDPERAVLKDMPASPANKKARVKDLKKQLKEAERREKQRKQAQKQNK